MNEPHIEKLSRQIQRLENQYKALKKQHKQKTLQLGLLWTFTILLNASLLFINMSDARKDMLLINTLALLITIYGMKLFFKGYDNRKEIIKKKQEHINVLTKTKHALQIRDTKMY